MRRSFALAVVAATLCACTEASPSGPTEAPTPTPSPASTAESTPGGHAPRVPLKLPHLPPQGIAVGVGAERSLVVLVNLRGEVLVRLPRFQLANPYDRPGVVLLQRRQQNYLLRMRTSILEPVSAFRARGLRQLGDGYLDLPPLQGTVDDDRSADWRWIDLASNGNVLLAQWIGSVGSECAVPIAHFVPVEEGAAAPVTGTAAPGNVPASWALGWARNDRAVVLLERGYCGTPSVGSGVWTFSAPGRGKRIPVPRIRGAYQFRMWGPSSAPSQP